MNKSCTRDYPEHFLITFLGPLQVYMFSCLYEKTSKIKYDKDFSYEL